MLVRYRLLMPIALLLLSVELPSGNAQQSQYPLMEKIAQKVIEKYQTSSCEELKTQKEQPPAAPEQEQMKKKVVAALKNDPKMREQFLNKVAGPIANKLFECGMVP